MSPQQAGGLVAIADAQLAPSPVAVGVDRGLGHAELARDLLGAQVLVDQAQALALALRQQLDRMRRGVGPRGHVGLQLTPPCEKRLL